ncbi:MAG: hypothetical protein JWM11_4390 [Planctomycetaceae bacterium]|nr:hypothetical protein [Planctomycetaceae bacterium]
MRLLQYFSPRSNVSFLTVRGLKGEFAVSIKIGFSVFGNGLSRIFETSQRRKALPGRLGRITERLEDRALLTAVISGLNDINFNENTVNASPQIIDTDVTVTDSNPDKLNNGHVFVQYTNGGGPEDQLSIHDAGTGAGQIGFSNGTVTYGGLTIGTVPVSGTGSGHNGAGLAIALTSVNATPEAVTALLQDLAYGNSSDTPTPFRTITVTVQDLDGTSNEATSKIGVINESEIPAITIPDTPGTYQLKQSPALIAPDATFSYTNIVDAAFVNSQLKVSIASGHSKKDQLGIAKTGSSDTEQITVKGHKILNFGIPVASFSGGKGKQSDLTITLTNSTTNAEINTILHRLTFSAKQDAGVNRTVNIQLKNVSGAVNSNIASRDIAVSSK